MIPALDLTRQYQEHKLEIAEAIFGVLESGKYINGPRVAAFEAAMAQYVGTAHAVALNSGTDALYLALRALDIGPDDEVVTTAFTFAATSEAIAATGAKPVFVDIDPMTFNLDPDGIESALTTRTKAILPVHLYGLPADMTQILEIADRHGLEIIEDCAQAIGAEVDGRRVGSLGTIGCFSFFPTKNLGAYGDGGMITTNDHAVAQRVRKLRAHGAVTKYYHEEVGVNSRLDEIQAAILLAKLRHIESWIERRRRLAARYDRFLRILWDIQSPTVPQGVRHVYHQYTIRVWSGRDALREFLGNRGIQSTVYYPTPLHLQPVHAQLGLRFGTYPEAERATLEVLSLPLFPEMRDDEVRAVADALREATLTQRAKAM
jgi:dTDP-4-amino-4,6-dideoxygalactose transaminase